MALHKTGTGQIFVEWVNDRMNVKWQCQMITLCVCLQTHAKERKCHLVISKYKCLFSSLVYLPMQDPEINSTLNIWGSSCLNEQMNPNHISWRNCEINCVDIYLGRKQLTQRDRVMMVTENSSEALEKELFSSHYVCLDNYNQLISLELNTTYNHFAAYF